MLKNHLNNRNFNLQERMMTVYTQNIKLQNKLDSIHLKAGEYDQIKTRQTSYNKTPLSETKGSLNYLAKKREAMRIDQENLKMAQRIVGKKPTMTNKELAKDYEKFAKTKAFLEADTGLNIDSIVKQ